MAFAFVGLFLFCFMPGMAQGAADGIDSQLDRIMTAASAGDLDEAIDDISFLMLRNSRYPRVHYVSGVLLGEKGEMVQALREYRKAYDSSAKEISQLKFYV